MESKQEQKRDRSLKAALDCFVQYGFKRTSMDDIAQKADISRAALYALFQNKEDIFKTLSEQMHGAAVDRAVAALQSQAPFGDRLLAAFEEKDLEMFALINTSLHGAELVAIGNAIGKEIMEAAERRFTKSLNEAVCQADRTKEIQFSHVTFNAAQFTEMLMTYTFGLRGLSVFGAEYSQRLGYLISAFSVALKV